MANRRYFLTDAAALTAAALLPLPARAQTYGVVRELSGEVFLNGARMGANSELRSGHTITTGRDGRIWFTLGGDAYFLRPESELRLQSSEPPDTLVDLLRLVTGALGGTFSRGARRSLVTRAATIGIRGTGVYIEAAGPETYACTCFGATELRSTLTGRMLDSIPLSTERHIARRITAAGVAAAGFQGHTSEEIARLEALVGRPYPF